MICFAGAGKDEGRTQEHTSCILNTILKREDFDSQLWASFWEQSSASDKRSTCCCGMKPQFSLNFKHPVTRATPPPPAWTCGSDSEPGDKPDWNRCKSWWKGQPLRTAASARWCDASAPTENSFRQLFQPWNVAKWAPWSRAQLTPFPSQPPTSWVPAAYLSFQISGATATQPAGKCHCSARRPQRRCHPPYRSLFALSRQRQFITAVHAGSALSSKPLPTKQLFQGMDARSLLFCHLRRFCFPCACVLCVLSFFDSSSSPSVSVFVSSLDFTHFSQSSLSFSSPLHTWLLPESVIKSTNYAGEAQIDLGSNKVYEDSPRKPRLHVV